MIGKAAIYLLLLPLAIVLLAYVVVALVVGGLIHFGGQAVCAILPGMCANTPFGPGTPVRTAYAVDDSCGLVPAGSEGIVMAQPDDTPPHYRKYIMVDLPELEVIMYALPDLLEYA